MSNAVKIVHGDNWRIPEWFNDLSTGQLEALKKVHSELCRFNNTLNLVSPKTMPVADILHFSDSIMASRLIVKDRSFESIHDIGSGGGFPGIIFAILYPHIKVTLVESDLKKIEFLRHISNAAGQKNILFCSDPVETIPAGNINVCMTRGFAPVSKTIFILRKIVQKGGALYMLKSEEWATEVSQIPVQLCSHWRPSLVGNYKLPIGDITFSLLKLDKIS